MRVLVVDDSSLFSERFEDVLSSIQGIDVVGRAENADRAKDSIRRLKPDVVTLDVRLPNGSGLDVLRFLKKVNPKPKVIVITNYPYPQLRRKFMEEGADYFFDKSIDFDEIAKVLNHLAVYYSPPTK